MKSISKPTSCMKRTAICGKPRTSWTSWKAGRTAAVSVISAGASLPAATAGRSRRSWSRRPPPRWKNGWTASSRTWMIFGRKYAKPPRRRRKSGASRNGRGGINQARWVCVWGLAAALGAAQPRARADTDADTIAAVKGLIDALKDKDAAVRKSAVKSLGRIGPAAKEAVPALIQALKDEEVDVRGAA